MAGRDSDDVGLTWHRSCQNVRLNSVVAELAVVVVAPALESSSADDGARVSTTGADLCDRRAVRRPRESGHVDGQVDRS